MDTDEHTCMNGPFCEQFTLSLDDPRPQDNGQPECEHESCMHILMCRCMPCEAAVMAEVEREWEKYQARLPYLTRGFCPLDMTELAFEAFVAAPGYGNSHRCRANHYWLWADRHWYSEEDLQHYVPELSIWDVI